MSFPRLFLHAQTRSTSAGVQGFRLCWPWRSVRPFPCGTRRPLEWQRSGLLHQIFAPSTLLKKLGAQVGEKIMRRTIRKCRNNNDRCSLLLAAFHLILSPLLVD